jgi:hypothetical protein
VAWHGAVCHGAAKQGQSGGGSNRCRVIETVARRGEVGHGEEGQGGVWQGNPGGPSGRFIASPADENSVRSGGVGRGEAWLGGAWPGGARQSCRPSGESTTSLAAENAAGPGVAWRGGGRSGLARQGKGFFRESQIFSEDRNTARCGSAECSSVRSGKVGQGRARSGRARYGKIGRGTLETDGFIHLCRNRYLKRNPERLYRNGEHSVLGTTRVFHGVYFEVDERMLDAEEYRSYLILGKDRVR